MNELTRQLTCPGHDWQVVKVFELPGMQQLTWPVELPGSSGVRVVGNYRACRPRLGAIERCLLCGRKRKFRIYDVNCRAEFCPRYFERLSAILEHNYGAGRRRISERKQSVILAAVLELRGWRMVHLSLDIGEKDEVLRSDD
jgi:hypothetical protein